MYMNSKFVRSASAVAVAVMMMATAAPAVNFMQLATPAAYSVSAAEDDLVFKSTSYVVSDITAVSGGVAFLESAPTVAVTATGLTFSGKTAYSGNGKYAILAATGTAVAARINSGSNPSLDSTDNVFSNLAITYDFSSVSYGTAPTSGESREYPTTVTFYLTIADASDSTTGTSGATAGYSFVVKKVDTWEAPTATGGTNTEEPNHYPIPININTAFDLVPVTGVAGIVETNLGNGVSGTPGTANVEVDRKAYDKSKGESTLTISSLVSGTAFETNAFAYDVGNNAAKDAKFVLTVAGDDKNNAIGAAISQTVVEGNFVLAFNGLSIPNDATELVIWASVPKAKGDVADNNFNQTITAPMKAADVTVGKPIDEKGKDGVNGKTATGDNSSATGYEAKKEPVEGVAGFKKVGTIKIGAYKVQNSTLPFNLFMPRGLNENEKNAKVKQMPGILHLMEAPATGTKTKMEIYEDSTALSDGMFSIPKDSKPVAKISFKAGVSDYAIKYGSLELSKKNYRYRITTDAEGKVWSGLSPVMGSFGAEADTRQSNFEDELDAAIAAITGSDPASTARKEELQSYVGKLSIAWKDGETVGKPSAAVVGTNVMTFTNYPGKTGDTLVIDASEANKTLFKDNYKKGDVLNFYASPSDTKPLAKYSVKGDGKDFDKGAIAIKIKAGSVSDSENSVLYVERLTKLHIGSAKATVDTEAVPKTTFADVFADGLVPAGANLMGLSDKSGKPFTAKNGAYVMFPAISSVASVTPTKGGAKVAPGALISVYDSAPSSGNKAASTGKLKAASDSSKIKFNDAAKGKSTLANKESFGLLAGSAVNSNGGFAWVVFTQTDNSGKATMLASDPIKIEFPASDDPIAPNGTKIVETSTVYLDGLNSAAVTSIASVAPAGSPYPIGTGKVTITFHADAPEGIYKFYNGDVLLGVASFTGTTTVEATFKNVLDLTKVSYSYSGSNGIETKKTKTKVVAITGSHITVVPALARDFKVINGQLWVVDRTDGATEALVQVDGGVPRKWVLGDSFSYAATPTATATYLDPTDSSGYEAAVTTAKAAGTFFTITGENMIY